MNEDKFQKLLNQFGFDHRVSEYYARSLDIGSERLYYTNVEQFNIYRYRAHTNINNNSKLDIRNYASKELLKASFNKNMNHYSDITFSGNLHELESHLCMLYPDGKRNVKIDELLLNEHD